MRLNYLRLWNWLRVKWHNMTPANRFMVVFTGIIAAATVVYSIMAVRQLVALQTSNRITQSALVISQRAYVVMPETSITSGIDRQTGKKGWLFTPRLENAGNTPALAVRQYVSQNSPAYKALPENFAHPDIPSPIGAFPNSNTKGGPAVIGPHEKIDTAGLGVIDDVLEGVNAGTSHVYFWGWASYDDVFSCGHKTEFCEEVVAMSKDGHFIFNNCTQHNCVDNECSDFKPTKKPLCETVGQN